MIFENFYSSLNQQFEKNLSFNLLSDKNNRVLINANLFRRNKKLFNSSAEFLEQLNKKEIFLLAHYSDNNNNEQNKLLGLSNPEQLSNNWDFSFFRRNRFKLFTRQTGFYEKQLRNRPFKFTRIMRPALYPIAGNYFHSGKKYYRNDLGGYKKICLAFFDKQAAEEMLLKVSSETITLMRFLPKKTDKKVLKGFLKTKIISYGLGDFLEFYNQSDSKRICDKTEFIFIPKFDDIAKKAKLKKILPSYFDKGVKFETFFDYQKQLNNLKNEERLEQEILEQERLEKEQREQEELDKK